ncbi:DUF3572 domain-containing protein [Kordiimonas sp.]|uniref:DUF3572 domain-containing protein n=1 Tax=Kordiimonas sp. TaxID=1970157 RepID=UPI003A90CCA3
MTNDMAEAIALQAAAFIFSEDTLRDRFLALSGTEAHDIRARIQDCGFQASMLEFLLGHEPDLLSFASAEAVKPEIVVTAWRTLGGGTGQEW